MKRFVTVLSIITCPFLLVSCVTGSPEERVKTFFSEQIDGAEAGNIKSKYTVAMYTIEGKVPIKDQMGLEIDIPVERNFERSARYWTQIRDYCSPDLKKEKCTFWYSIASVILAFQNKYGLGVTLSHEKAYRLFQELEGRIQDGAMYYQEMYHEMADTFLFGRGGPKNVKLAIKYLKFAITGFENKQHSMIHMPIVYDMAAFVAREGISPYVPGKDLNAANSFKNKADEARQQNLELFKAQSTAYQDAVRRSRALRSSALATEREFDTGVMMIFGAIAAARIASTNFAQAPAPASNTGVKFGFPIGNYYGGYFPNNMNPPGQFFIPVR